MSESILHLSMKTTVASELTKEGYEVIEEPLWPPTRFVSWNAYRPDLIGLLDRDGADEYALVECETNPTMRRLLSKNIWRVELQSKIDRDSRLRRILVLPRGKLGAVDPNLRRSCEIWIADGNSLLKIPMCPRY
jgi:hypothetical protein